MFQDAIEEEINPELKEEYLKKNGSIKEILSRNDSLTLKYKEKKGINGKMRKIFEILCVELEFLVNFNIIYIYIYNKISSPFIFIELFKQFNI